MLRRKKGIVAKQQKQKIDYKKDKQSTPGEQGEKKKRVFVNGNRRETKETLRIETVYITSRPAQ